MVTFSHMQYRINCRCSSTLTLTAVDSGIEGLYHACQMTLGGPTELACNVFHFGLSGNALMTLG